MRRLHVLMTVDAVGGVWRYALDLTQALADLGVRVTLVSVGPAPGAAQLAETRELSGVEFVQTGLPLDWLASDPEELGRAALSLAALAGWSGADVVHINHPALAAARFEVPVVAVAHSCLASWWRRVRGGAMPTDFVWRCEFTAAGYHAAQTVVAPSAAFANDTAEIYGLAPPTVVYNARPGSLSARRVPRAAFAFTAGRLWDDGKNASALDRAAALARIPVLAAGPTTGPNGASFLPKALRALGPLPAHDVIRAMQSASLFVSTARYEPFGLSVLEAAQCGCPLLLSDIPTFRELWDGAAEFVDPEDAGAVAAAIERLAGDADLAARLGREARRRARRFDVGRMAGAMLDVYRAASTAPASHGAEEAA
jgi:glycosyltransferase involved in cell wall biosynthesis